MARRQIRRPSQTMQTNRMVAPQRTKSIRKKSLSEDDEKRSKAMQVINKGLRKRVLWPAIKAINVNFLKGRIQIPEGQGRNKTDVELFHQLIKMRRSVRNSLQKHWRKYYEQMKYHRQPKQISEYLENFSLKYRRQIGQNKRGLGEDSFQCRENMSDIFFQHFKVNIDVLMKKLRKKHPKDIRQKIYHILESDSYIISWFLVSEDRQKHVHVDEYFKSHKTINARGGTNKKNCMKIKELLQNQSTNDNQIVEDSQEIIKNINLEDQLSRRKQHFSSQ